MSKIRIGAVSYLNTKPLVYGLNQCTDCEITFDLPSRLSDGLVDGSYDVALIPSIEAFQSPQFTIVSDACIGSRGPVWSVKLLSRRPMDRIRTIACDEGSRTSVALTQILLKQRFGIAPEQRTLLIDDDWRQVNTDAVLIIGDRAMSCDAEEFPFCWDLGEQWYNWTELPFVFAMWTVRPFVPGTLDLDLIDSLLTSARNSGVKNIEKIAAASSKSYGLTTKSATNYLRNNLYFYMRAQERAGLKMFYHHAAAIDFAPRKNSLRFHDCTSS